MSAAAQKCQKAERANCTNDENMIAMIEAVIHPRLKKQLLHGVGGLVSKFFSCS